MASIVSIRRDASGTPRCSLTFLLDHAPAPHEQISALVLSATLALDLRCDLADLAAVRFTLDLGPDAVGDGVRAESKGPFGTAALAATLSAGPARALLTALARREGGPVLTVEARRRDGFTGRWQRALVPLVLDAMTGSDERVVHLTTTDGGEVSDVLPPRPLRTRDSGATPAPVMMLRGDVAMPITSMVKPQAVVATPWVVSQVVLSTPLQPITSHPVNGQPAEVAPVETGPVLDDQPLLADRSDDVHWYLPQLTLLRPDPGQDAETSPFRFDLATAGHTDDGAVGLEATITLTLAAAPSEASRAAWEAAGRPHWRPLPCEVLVALRLPFRDESGSATSEVVSATSTTLTGTLGDEGSRVTVVFALRDKWARLAYGALSTPGFQAEPPTVQVSLTHSGWRRVIGLAIDPASIGGIKHLALRRDRRLDRALAPTQVLGMAKARLEARPPVLVAEHALEKLRVTRWSRVSATDVQTVEAVLPCADHSQLYRQASSTGTWDVIGCQEALKLGQTTHRTWQPEPVTSTSAATVFRSLTQPGRFLVVPREHCIGRHAADDELALHPAVLLTSTIDVDEPANIRCVLAASLEPVFNDAETALLRAELATRIGRDVELVNPWQAGIEPTLTWAVPSADQVECVAVDQGFTMVLTTDIPGLLTLRTLLQRGGLVGSARYRMPGGDEALSTLRLDLDRIVGPSGGPLTLTHTADAVVVHNPLSSRVAVNRVVAGGAVVASPGLVLDGGAEATIVLPPGCPDPVLLDQEAEPSAENLDESRSYIDDLELGITFVAVGSLSAVAGLEISCEFLGATAAPVALTSTRRQAERQFVLPLTSYATDPALHFTVTAVAADGTRTSAAPVAWPVRSRGVLVPIDTPTVTAPA